jgi:hypothetical protein
MLNQTWFCCILNSTACKEYIYKGKIIVDFMLEKTKSDSIAQVVQAIAVLCEFAAVLQ